MEVLTCRITVLILTMSVSVHCAPYMEDLQSLLSKRNTDSNDRCLVFRCLMNFIRYQSETDCVGDLTKARQCAADASVCNCNHQLLEDTMDVLYQPRCECESVEVRECLKVVDELFLTMVDNGNPPPVDTRKRMYGAAEWCLGDIESKGLSKAGCEDKWEFPKGGDYLLLSAKAWADGCDDVKKVLIDCEFPLEYGCGPGEDVVDEFVSCVSSSLPSSACLPLTSNSQQVKQQIMLNQRDRCHVATQTQKKLDEQCHYDYNEEADNYIDRNYNYEHY